MWFPDFSVLSVCFTVYRTWALLFVLVGDFLFYSIHVIWGPLIWCNTWIPFIILAQHLPFCLSTNKFLFLLLNVLSFHHYSSNEFCIKFSFSITSSIGFHRSVRLLSVSLPVGQLVCLSVCLSVCLPVGLSACGSISLFVSNISFCVSITH